MYGISFFSRIRPLVHLRGEVLPYIQSASPPGAQTRALGLLELNQLTLRILEDKSHVTYHFYIQRHGIIKCVPQLRQLSLVDAKAFGKSCFNLLIMHPLFSLVV